MKSTSVRAADIAAVRRFNRFYTTHVGVLRRTFLETPYSLGELRLLQEIAAAEQDGRTITASDLVQLLRLDAGYISRVLGGFQRKRLVARKVSTSDARRSHLTLTRTGRALFEDADARQVARTRRTLAGLTAADRTQLVEAMARIIGLIQQAEAREADREASV